jgi:predicted transcriptional regulator
MSAASQSETGAMRKNAEVSDAEMEVLRTLWEGGPGTVREVDARLQPLKRGWAYTTIQTLLNRLETKGYVKSDKRGLAHVFRAAVSRERFLSQRLQELSEEVCDGTATPLVMALVRGHRFTPAEIEQFRRLIEGLDTEAK